MKCTFPNGLAVWIFPLRRRSNFRRTVENPRKVLYLISRYRSPDKIFYGIFNWLTAWYQPSRNSCYFRAELSESYTHEREPRVVKMKVVVRSVLNEFSFEAEPRTPVRDIYTNVCKSLGIHETWYFGLMYYGPDNEEIWIEQSKKVGKSGHLSNCLFQFFPSSPVRNERNFCFWRPCVSNAGCTRMHIPCNECHSSFSYRVK